MPPRKVAKRAPKVFFYVRCSTDKQDVTSQQTGIAEWLADKKITITDTVIDDAVSGTVPWQERKIGTIVDQALDGDTLVVSEISRLGRIAAEVLTIVKQCHDKGITIHVQKGNMIIDNTISGKMIVFMMALMAELERDLISQRTKQGMANARAKGKQIGGRKPGWVYKDKILDPAREELDKALKSGIKQKSLAEKYGVSPAKISAYIRKHKIGPVKREPAPESKEIKEPPSAPPTAAAIAAALRPPSAPLSDYKEAGIDEKKIAKLLKRDDNVIEEEEEGSEV